MQRWCFNSSAFSNNSKSRCLSGWSLASGTLRFFLSWIFSFNVWASASASFRNFFMSRPSASNLWFYNCKNYCNFNYFWHKGFHEQHPKQQLTTSFQQHVPVALERGKGELFAILWDLSHFESIGSVAEFIDVLENCCHRLPGEDRVMVDGGFVTQDSPPNTIHNCACELPVVGAEVFRTSLKPNENICLNYKTWIVIVV